MSDEQKLKKIKPREWHIRWQFGQFLPGDVKKLRRYQRRLWRLEKDK